MASPDPEPIVNWAAGSGHPVAPDGPAGDRAVPGGIWLNGTGVAVAGHGIAILGSSGCGKSSLALSLLALGGVLIADDGLWLVPAPAPPRLIRPTQAPDLIEARGIGLLHAGPTLAEAPLALVVDLDRAETERLPAERQVSAGAGLCPLILGAGNPNLASAIILLARNGRAPV